jgi:hypothetical protein
LFVAITLIFIISSEAYASFSSEMCSNPDRSVTYNYNKSWDKPQSKIWVIDGKEFTTQQVKEEIITPRSNLESFEDEMVSRSTYTKKVKLKYTLNNESKEVVTWLICKSASGL